MLCQLSIKNIALVDNLSIEFTDGLNVLTGETGAGKSIVIDSVNLALGERADRGLIRAGQQRAQIEALFDLSVCEAAKKKLEELGIDTQDDQLVVSREITQTGHNVVRMNGSLTPLSSLKTISSLLVDVHGQHEHQSLMDESRHIGFLDGFARERLEGHLSKCAELYRDWRGKEERYRRIVGNTQQRAQRLDMLRFQSKEIENAKLKSGEEEELRQMQALYRNYEKIVGGLSQASIHLNGGQHGEGALDALRETADALSGALRFMPELTELESTVNQALYLAEDVAVRIEEHLQSMNYSERDAEQIENRLDEIRKVERKYGATVEAVQQYRSSICEEIRLLEEDEEDVSALEEALDLSERALMEEEKVISSLRHEAAKRFEKAMLAQLADLGMSGAEFRVEFLPLPNKRSGFAQLHSSRGYDRLHFLLSVNHGEPPKPLSRTASGGELSRIMLAFKTICAGDVSTMVFDEIDTGISGRMAQVVGEKMASIGREKQVICVTHLPQIAALGSSHHLVEKFSDEKRTYTRVYSLDTEQRIQELARMTGGRETTKAALDNARELLRLAADNKEK